MPGMALSELGEMRHVSRIQSTLVLKMEPVACLIVPFIKIYYVSGNASHLNAAGCLLYKHSVSKTLKAFSFTVHRMRIAPQCV